VYYADNGQAAIDIALQMAHRLYTARRSSSSSSNANSESTVLTRGGSNRAGHVSIPLPYVHYWQGKLSLDVKELDADPVRGAVYAEMARGLLTSSTQLFNWKQRMVTSSSSSSSSSSTGSLTGLAKAYKEYIHSFFQTQQEAAGVSAIILEPLLLSAGSGVGGLRFVDPLFQKLLILEAKQHGIPVIIDETSNGFFRLGVMSCCLQLLQETPDIACYAQMLTGGYLPLAATLASEEVYAAYQQSFAMPLEHAASSIYAGNPIACTAALEAIRLLENAPDIHPTTGMMKASFSEESVRDLSKLPGVVSAYSLGTVLSIQLPPPLPDSEGDSLTSLVISLLHAERIQAYPSQHCVYILCTPFSTMYDKHRVLRVLRRCLTQAFYLRPSAALEVQASYNAHSSNSKSVETGVETMMDK
jgi:dethiobiotin synthetase/adenosylmethionine--8-amino-7-oxononanoate aminotransferase